MERVQIILGTRGSELARAEARLVEKAIRTARPGVKVENGVIVTKGATVATGSVRRKYQLSWKRPDLRLVDLRGNVPTRLRKLAENNWDAIVLARAGLERLGLSPTHNEINFEGRQFFLEILPSEIFL